MQSMSSSPISGMPTQNNRVIRGNGGFSIIGLPFALVLGVIGGIATGIALFFSGKLIYLIVASALFAGLIAGVFAILAVRLGKIRNGFLGFLLGLAIGVLTYGAYWGAEYVGTILDLGNEARTQIREGFAQNGVSASDADIENEMNAVLQELTGSTDFMGLMKLVDLDLQDQTGNTGIIGYISYQAQEGFSITRAGSSASASNDPPIKDGLAWGYFGIELLIIGLASAFMGSWSARQAFCQNKKRWLKLEPTAEVAGQYIDVFMNTFKSGDLQTASQYLQPINRKTPMPKLQLEVGRCDAQSPTGSIRIKLYNVNRKNQRNEQVLFNGEIDQLNLLLNR